MTKLKVFFNKNYDYYILIAIISLSFLLSVFEYVGVFVIQGENTDFEEIIPCYVFDHYKFNNWATFESNEFVVEMFSKPPRSNLRILIDTIAENVLAFILIFGFYYLGKKLFYRTKKRIVKWGLITILILYLISIILFEYLLIWGCCCFHFG